MSAIVKSKLLSKWIGGAGVVIGAVTIYAGLEVAYLGFGGLTTIIGISMIIYFIWAGILGGFMWKNQCIKWPRPHSICGLNGFCNLYILRLMSNLCFVMMKTDVFTELPTA